MPEEGLGKIEPLLTWYKRIGNVTVESLGLDSRTVIIKLEGKRKSLRSLVTLFDPSSGIDFLDWLEDLIESHKRAGIEFDRVEVWVPPERLDESEMVSEKLKANVVVRSLSELEPTASFGFELMRSGRGVMRRGIPLLKYDQEGEEITVQSNPKEKLISETIPDKKANSSGNKGREEDLSRILDDIKEIIDRSMRTILNEVRRDNEIDLIKRVDELEKRVELLEAMIRLLGNQRIPAGELSIHREVEPRYHIGQERTKDDSNKARTPERKPEVTDSMQQVNIPLDNAKPESPTSESSEDVLEEILRNPWVKILGKKGENVEG